MNIHTVTKAKTMSEFIQSIDMDLFLQGNETYDLIPELNDPPCEPRGG